MPHPKRSRSSPSTCRPFASTLNVFPSVETSSREAPARPRPNVLSTRQIRSSSPRNVTTTRGRASRSQGMYWFENVEVCGSNNAARSARTIVVLPRSFGPKNTLSPSPNATLAWWIRPKSHTSMLRSFTRPHRRRDSTDRGGRARVALRRSAHPRRQFPGDDARFAAAPREAPRSTPRCLRS